MNRRRRKSSISPVAGVIFAVLCTIALFTVAGWIENKEKKPEIHGDFRERYAYDNVIEVNGHSYRQRKELTTILLMGVDRDSDAEARDARDGGQADFQRVIVLDPQNKTMSQLAIDRDTMTPVTILGVLGNYAGVRTMQVSLAHGYGDGKTQSCELAVEAVSNLLMNTKIDYYAAMNLDGISALNDWVGGVTLTLEDDFSGADPSMTPGTTLTLVGKQSEIYVRARMDVSDGTNASRMKRQEQYMSVLSKQLNDRLRENKDNIRELYDTMEPYMITNMPRGMLINEIWAARDYQYNDVTSIPGVHKDGEDGFMEFYADEEALQQIVLAMFYEELD